MELEQIAIKVNEISEKSCEGQLELGRLLLDAKSKVKHGQWKKWLDENTNFSQSKANKLMKTYNFVDSLNLYTCTNLNIRKIFALTTLKNEIDVQMFIENFDLENMSVREIEKEVRLYNKQLKADEQEQKKSKEVVTINKVKNTYTKEKTYTSIETEIKVGGLSYYMVDEVSDVMEYKTLAEFHEKYSDLIVIIKGSECIKASDFLRISAEENNKCKDIDFDENNVEVDICKAERSDLFGMFMIYKIKINKRHVTTILTYGRDLTSKGEIDKQKVCEVVTKQLHEAKIYDKKAIQFTTILILEHLETLKEDLMAIYQQEKQFEKTFNDAFSTNENKVSSSALTKSEYRLLCKVCHPDNGGSEELMNIISKLYKK